MFYKTTRKKRKKLRQQVRFARLLPPPNPQRQNIFYPMLLPLVTVSQRFQKSDNRLFFLLRKT